MKLLRELISFGVSPSLALEATQKRTHIFIAKPDFDRAAMNDTAAKLGVRFTAKGAGDKNLPGFDVLVMGDDDAVAQFLMRHGLKKGISKGAALEFVRSNVMEAAPRKADVKKVVELAKAGDVDAFMVGFVDAFQSAADVWLNQPKLMKLMKLMAKGTQVKCVFDADGGKTADAQKRKLTAAGWKLFDEEFNMDSYEAIYFKPATPVTESEARTVELTDDTVGTIDHTVWPKGVTYKGRNVFDSVYENRPMALTHAEKLLKADDTDWDNRLEFQEVYLGYSPSKDVFIHGYDGWRGDGNCSPFIIFTMNAGGDVKVVQKGKDITRRGAMWYGQGSSGGHAATKRRFPDLIDIRLD